MLLTEFALLLISLSHQSTPPNWVQTHMAVPSEVEQCIPLGQKSAKDLLHISVSLPYRDQEAMQQFADSVSDPHSPNYGQFITPKEVGSRYGLANSAVTKVVDYLKSYGMKIRLVGDNRLAILADATVSQAQAAFHTSITEFLPLNGADDLTAKRFTYATAPSVPNAISPYVIYIGGLENFTQPIHHTSITAAQLRTLYSFAPTYAKGNRGQGRTIGISNWAGYRLNNLALEYSHFGLPTPPGGVGKNIVIQSINNMDGRTISEDAEGDLDIQCPLAMAPLATLIIYDDAGDNDMVGVLTQEANDNKADIISESYGWSGGAIELYAAANNQHLSMTAQGITYMCSSGDTGTWGLIQMAYPDDDPEVLTVGGTTVTVDILGNRKSEVGWTGSGGGYSIRADTFDRLPAYQKGKGVPTKYDYRLVPDLALDADPYTGYEIYFKGALSIIGGTSCSSPTMAGALAACEQQIIAGGGLKKSPSGKQRFGRIQDLLYSFNGDPTIFNDITSGTNGSLPEGGISAAGPGWDTVTGWGTMIFSGFVNKILKVATMSKVALSATSVLGGNSVTGTVTLKIPSPYGGTVVNLKTSNANASVAGSVVIPAGSSTATFTVQTTPLATTGTTVVTATTNNTSATASLTIKPIDVATVSITPSSVVGGVFAVGTVQLNGPAPVANFSVNLTSSTPNASVPPKVTFSMGSNVSGFKVITKVVASTITATISAKHATFVAKQTLSIQPATLQSLTISPSSVVGGGNVSPTGTVTLTGPAPAAGATVMLSSSAKTAATVPTSVQVAGGATTATFPITTLAVGSDVQVNIQGVLGAVAQQGSLTVRAVSLAALDIRPSTVQGSSNTVVTGTITLDGPAPASGLVIGLTSSQSTVVTVPSTVTIPAGQTSGTFTVGHYPMTAQLTVTITAKQGAVTRTATLTVTTG